MVPLSLTTTTQTKVQTKREEGNRKQLTDNNKLNRQGGRWRPEAELRARTAAPVVISCLGMQRADHDVVDLPGGVEEVGVLCLYSGGRCIVFARCRAVLHRRRHVVVGGNP